MIFGGRFMDPLPPSHPGAHRAVSGPGTAPLITPNLLPIPSPYLLPLPYLYIYRIFFLNR